MRLKKKNVLITGGSKGIGRGLVMHFLREGADVLTFARNEESLKVLEGDSEGLPGKLFTISGDALREDFTDLIEGAIDKHLSALDVLVNNLGGIREFGDSLEEVSDEQFREAFDLNVMTMVRLVRKLIPRLKESKQPRIITISSISAVQPSWSNPHYSLTKAATVNFSKYLANKLADAKVCVNVVCPGPVKTDLWDMNARDYARKNGITFEEADFEFSRRASEWIPLRRVGKPEDLAGLVGFLASDEASWITGSCFHVSGGKMLSAF